MRFFSSFFAFFAAFFSLAVMAGCFLVSFLLSCALPMVLAFALNRGLRPQSGYGTPVDRRNLTELSKFVILLDLPK